MNISEIPTDEMLIIMDKIKSDENSWIGKETVRALSERNIEKTKEPNGVVVMNPDINGDYEEKIKIRQRKRNKEDVSCMTASSFLV